MKIKNFVKRATPVFCAFALVLSISSVRANAVVVEGTSALAATAVASYMTSTGIELSVIEGGLGAADAVAGLIGEYAVANGTTAAAVNASIASGVTLSGGTIILGVAAVALIAGIVAWIVANKNISDNNYNDIYTYNDTSLFGSSLPSYGLSGSFTYTTKSVTNNFAVSYFTPGFTSLPDGALPIFMPSSGNDIFYTFADGPVLRAKWTGTMPSSNTCVLYLQNTDDYILEGSSVDDTVWTDLGDSYSWNTINNGCAIRALSAYGVFGQFRDGLADKLSVFYCLCYYNNCLFVYPFVQFADDSNYYLIALSSNVSTAFKQYVLYDSRDSYTVDFTKVSDATSTLSVDLSAINSGASSSSDVTNPSVVPELSENEQLVIELPSQFNNVEVLEPSDANDYDLGQLLDDSVSQGDLTPENTPNTIEVESPVPQPSYDSNWNVQPETGPSYDSTPSDEPTSDPDLRETLPGDTFAGPWHYVLETFEYIAEFMVAFGMVINSLPYALRALLWASLVLLLLFGLLVKLLK